MSLEEALAANTAALKELTAALLAAGALQSAQTSAAAHSSPAVQAVVKAQKEADVKKQSAATKPDAGAADAKTAEQTTNESKPSGEPSASTPTSSSQELQPWHEKTAKLFGELGGSEPTLDNLRKAVLGINQHIGRPQAMAILQRFGAQAITPKLGPDGKTVITAGLDDDQYPEAFALCLEVLAGRVDATAAVTE